MFWDQITQDKNATPFVSCAIGRTVFEEKDVPYNFRENNSLTLPKGKRTLYGIDTIRYISKKLWQTLPTEVKESQSLEIFKQKIKLITNLDCSCRLCKNFVPGPDFI